LSSLTFYTTDAEDAALAATPLPSKSNSSDSSSPTLSSSISAAIIHCTTAAHVDHCIPHLIIIVVIQSSSHYYTIAIVIILASSECLH
jgi:hypothetical protein